MTFVEELSKTVAGPLAVKLAVAKMRPQVEPKLKKKGLKYDEVAPVLSTIDTLEKLEGAAEDPIQYLDQVAETLAWPIAAKLVVARMQPQVAPVLKKSNIDWKAVEPALQLIDSPEKLAACANDPLAFMEKVRA